MVANVLIISNSHKNITSVMQKLYYNVSFANNFERALRIVRNGNIDVVLLFKDAIRSREDADFFHIFRELCNIIPIIYFVDSFDDIPNVRLDSIIRKDCPTEIILNKIDVFKKVSEKFDLDIIGNLDFNSFKQKKATLLLYNKIDFIDEEVFDGEIVLADSISEDILDSDIFIINSDKRRARKVCAKLRLMHVKAPILFTYTTPREDKISKELLDVGCTDVLPTFIAKKAITYEINSLIRFKKIYDFYIKNIKEQSYSSAIDATTGIYNRSFFEGYIKKYNLMKSDTAIFMIDVDKFKSINDNFGHAFADRALNHIVKIIKGNIRASDVIARYGGDEFIIVMQNISKHKAEQIAERIRTQVFNFKLEDARFSLSIGVCCECVCLPMREGISVADRFMYAAKQSGGNSVRVCS